MSESGDIPEWVRKGFAEMERWKSASSLNSHLTDVEAHPAWVTKVTVELIAQQHPAIDPRKMTIDANGLGRYLGQACANYYDWGERIANVPEAVSPDLLKALEQVQAELESNPISRAAMPHLQALCETFDANVEALVTLSTGIFRAALETGKYHETLSLFEGFTKGLRCKRTHIRGAFTEATPIYERLLLDWKKIELLRSVTELRAFLLTRGLTQEQLGDPKRLQKICERIGLRFRKPGRPKKSDTLSR